MKSGLENIFKGNVVIVGIGNILRGDDGFGPELIERIKDEVDAVCIDAGNAPENYAGKITKLKPDTILIADAVHLDLEPGEYEILIKDDIIKSGFTTHNLSPAMLMEYLEKETDANIYVLGVQPESTSFSQGLSTGVEKTLEKLSQLIIDSINREK